MKKINRFKLWGSGLLFPLLLAFGSHAIAQATLTQTTLSAAVNGPGATTTPSQSQVSLASATGVNIGTNGPVTQLYVDGEVMSVVSLVNGQTTIFNVLRGQMSTPVESHAASAMVYVVTGSPSSGGVGYGGLQQRDPDVGANCTITAQAYNLYINVLTGQQWQCQNQTNAKGTVIATWIPVTMYRTSAVNSPLSVFVTTNYTNATETASNITGLSFYAQPYHNYHVKCEITWQSSATADAPSYTFTGPANDTAFVSGLWSPVTSSTFTTASGAAYSTALSNAGTVTASTYWTDQLSFDLLNGATPGTLQVKAAGVASGTITIYAGSSCLVQ